MVFIFYQFMESQNRIIAQSDVEPVRSRRSANRSTLNHVISCAQATLSSWSMRIYLVRSGAMQRHAVRSRNIFEKRSILLRLTQPLHQHSHGNGWRRSRYFGRAWWNFVCVYPPLVATDSTFIRHSLPMVDAIAVTHGAPSSLFSRIFWVTDRRHSELTRIISYYSYWKHKKILPGIMLSCLTSHVLRHHVSWIIQLPAGENVSQKERSMIYSKSS
jgi:hypothetical protein